MILSRPKRLFLPLLLLAISACTLSAQTLDEGIRYYRQKDYRQAVSIFNQMKEAKGYLFAAKSFYALGDYHQARANLNNISSDAAPKIYAEAGYTAALVDFQQKEFSQSLLKLYNVHAMGTGSSLTNKSQKLYDQILGYLTAGQRIRAIKDLSEDEIKFDLLKSGLGTVDFKGAKKLYDSFRDQVDDKKWRKKSDKYDVTVSSPTAYKHEFGTPAERLTPPKGTIYHLGVALPSYGPDKPEYGIVKALYFGIMLAADQYNKSHDAHVNIHFIAGDPSGDDIESHLKNFKNTAKGDAVIGPLYSSQAEKIASLVTDLRLPTLAPLANDDIHADGSYLFQANPTFKMHGKKMADYAVQVLKMTNFAVIANRSSRGKKSAESFREEAENKGANINYYFVHDLRANNYELANYVKQLGSRKQVEAVYAPFTGDQSSTLIDLLAADLRSMRQPRTVLGSQEYRNLNFQSPKYDSLDVYFSESTYARDSSLNSFKQAYHQKFGSYGNRYSAIGYDMAAFLLQKLHQVGNPELLKQAISGGSTYHGFLRDISFEGGNINTAIKIMHVTTTGNVVQQH